jgi:signal transduction histidine kinase/ligand-binding sensor domain-containing protein
MISVQHIFAKKHLAFSALTVLLRTMRRIRRIHVAVLFLALFAPASVTVAEQPPLRKYTTADGLASNAIYCVKRDSHGFLWFCTAEGLSRFDGYNFTNYSVEQGLPDRLVTDFLEARNGEYWVGTPRGVARFNPKPGKAQPYFTVYRPGNTEEGLHINALFQDREGTIWVTTNDGLFQLIESAGTWIFRSVNLGTAAARIPKSNDVQQDREGDLWIALGDYGSAALCRLSRGGQSQILTIPFLKENRITSLFIDREDRIWVSTYRGLALLSPLRTGLDNFVARIFTKKDGLLDNVVGRMFQSADGRLWLESGGLLEVIVRGDGIKFRTYGLIQQGFRQIDSEDIDGNFWMGATKLSIHGFVNYGREDGLHTEDVRSIGEGRDGELYVVTGTHSRFINRFDGTRFYSVAPLSPGHDASLDWGGWGWGQIHLQDHLGEWWFMTGAELYRYPRVRRLEDLASTPPRRIYHLGEANIFRLYEDSRGDIWISAWDAGLLRWERATETFHSYGQKEGLPPASELPTSFREDRAGNLWMGMWGQDLVRLRHGHFDAFLRANGFPGGSVFSIWLDHAGRIWVATSRGGLVRIDKPDEENPGFRVYTTNDGLSSNDVRAITEDHFGRIYFWTGRGVDRLEPETGAILHYTTADGLIPSGSDNQEAFCDRHGTLWFGFTGLSRLDPVPPSETPPSLPIYVTHVRVRGENLPISELGETRLSRLVLQPNQNDLQIEFGSLNFGAGETIRYQYKLEGSGGEWSSPSTLRRVNYADLRSGSYRFVVRALGMGGEVSPSTAEMGFRVLAPFWQRWWFLSILAALIGLAIYGLYRYRLSQLLELERIRTRIASNLHDDIGSSLTQIAILSEVANRTLDGSEAGASEPLSRIADISREAVDSMSDIVWAVNPGKDSLRDLTQRMRRFASDVLSARGIELSFHAPDERAETELRGDVRQEVFFIFKEVINNIVRHAESHRAEVRFSLHDGEIVLRIGDDGKGFEESASVRDDGHGHGLASMRARAQDFGGTCEISSQPGHGTRISVRLPVERRGPPRVTKIPT